MQEKQLLMGLQVFSGLFEKATVKMLCPEMLTQHCK